MNLPLKKIRSIAFIEPKNSNLNIYTKYELPRLGCTILATIMQREGYESRAYFLSEREIIKRNIDSDVVGISTISSTAIIAFRLADYFRSLGKIVIMGGPHVSALPDECLDHGQYALMGEGEVAVPAFIRALTVGSPLTEVPGLVWRDSEGITHKNERSPFIEDLDSIPHTDFSLLEMTKKRMGGHPKFNTIPIQTSRGCPFNCNFCSVTATFGKKYRHRSTEHVISELRKFDPKKDQIFFYDDNFTANRAKAKELLRAMISENLIFRFSTQVRVDIAKDPELLDLMAEAGCNTLYIGFESVDPENLKEMNKNQTPEDITWAIKELRKRKIHIHGMFVFGFDNDTPKKAKATVRYAIHNRIDSVQFMILTPLPGTEFYYKMKNEGRLLDNNYEEYDAHHVKFRPIHFTPWQLQMAQVKAHASFYAWRHVFMRLMRGRIVAFIVGVYANLLNMRWFRMERSHLKKLKQIPTEVVNRIKSSTKLKLDHKDRAAVHIQITH